jgi:hypothetical protein
LFGLEGIQGCMRQKIHQIIWCPSRCPNLIADYTCLLFWIYLFKKNWVNEYEIVVVVHLVFFLCNFDRVIQVDKFQQ